MTRRKSLAKRQPNGEIARSKPEQHIPVDRVRQMISAGAIDPLYASPIGRLALAKRLDQAQFDAAVKYRADRSKVDKIIGLPPRSVRAIDYGKISGSAIGDHAISENDARSIKAFADIEAMLGRHSAFHKIVNRVVVNDEQPMFGELGTLVTGLEILAIGYGFKSKGKRIDRNP